MLLESGAYVQNKFTVLCVLKNFTHFLIQTYQRWSSCIFHGLLFCSKRYPIITHTKFQKNLFVFAKFWAKLKFKVYYFCENTLLVEIWTSKFDQTFFIKNVPIWKLFKLFCYKHGNQRAIHHIFIKNETLKDAWILYFYQISSQLYTHLYQP